MGLFVHLSPENQIEKIRKSGISVSKVHYKKIKKGVFCMPVINDFYSTHQWLRELRRFNKKNIVGIYFNIPDEEIVWIGHYNEEPNQMKASQAIKMFIEIENKMGIEVTIPRKIKASEIKKIKNLPQIIGWRYFPESHGKNYVFAQFAWLKEIIKSKYYVRINIMS